MKTRAAILALILLGVSQSLLAAAIPSAGVQIVAPADPLAVPKYEKVELTVALTTVAATCFDPSPAAGGVDLNATFNGPDGSTWTINGFYDGAAWRIRFAPMATGAWTFTLSATDAAGTAAWSGGTFTCVPSSHPGFARIDGLYLRFTGGQAQFAVGHNNGWQYDVEQPALSAMAACGENLLSFWLNSPWKTPADSEPRAPIENATQGVGVYNQPACAYIDGVVARAEAADVYLLPCLWSHGNLRYWNASDTSQNHPWGIGWWSNNAYSALGSATDFFQTSSGGADTPQWRYQKNFFRYLLARWGYSRAVISWVAVVEIEGATGYGYNGQPAVCNPVQATAWCHSVHDYFAAHDNFRLNSQSQYPLAITKSDWQADASTWSNYCDLAAQDSYTQQQNNLAIAQTIAGATSAMRNTSRPSFHTEFGGEAPATQPAHLHNGIWAGAAAGACMSPLLWCDGGSFPLLTDATVGDAMRQHLQYLSQFMAGVDYFAASGYARATVTASTSCRGWGVCVSGRGFAWIQNTAGHVGGQLVAISSLTPGAYNVAWYDVWSAGSTPIAAPQIVSVKANGTLSVKLPALSAADVVCKFFLNAAPTVAIGPSATPNPVLGTAAELSVLGADDAGENYLTYTWSVSGTPPAPVVFSDNGTNSAKNLPVIFSAPGNYTFQVVIQDSGGLTCSATVTVSVVRTAASVTVTPQNVEVLLGGTQQFTAQVDDQFGTPLAAAVTWSAKGGDTFDAAGIFTANALGGPFQVTATAGAASGAASVTVVAGLVAGTVALPPKAVNLSAEGACDWAHWGLKKAWDFDHRAGVARQISNYTLIGGGKVKRYAATGSPRYAWTGGTPASSAKRTHGGIRVSGQNNGFQITLPADTTARTLKLYVGVSWAGGKLTAALSDGSAPVYEDTSVKKLHSTAHRVYTIRFGAVSPGVVLTVTWTCAEGGGGVLLQAADIF